MVQADVRRLDEAPTPRLSYSRVGRGKTQSGTSWPLTPSNSQDSDESSFQPFFPTPADSTDGLIPIANDVRYSKYSAYALSESASRNSVATTASPPPERTSLRPARRLPPPPFALPNTPPPSPPREIATTSESYRAALMNSSISDDQDEETCPICLELLSLRLAGERPYVVPICGHRLREPISRFHAHERAKQVADPGRRVRPFLLRSRVRRPRARTNQDGSEPRTLRRLSTGHESRRRQ